MKNIKLEELAKIFDEGLKEEVHIGGNLIACVYTCHPENHLYVSGSGLISINKINSSSECYRIMVDSSNMNLEYATDKKIEVFMGREEGRDYYPPHITIPLSDKPEIFIKIDSIESIRY